jgi:hypothetical protein
MNKNIEIFYKFAKEHDLNFYHYTNNAVGYCTTTRCNVCTLNDSCTGAPVLTEEDFDYIKTENPEYMI